MSKKRLYSQLRLRRSTIPRWPRVVSSSLESNNPELVIVYIRQKVAIAVAAEEAVAEAEVAKMEALLELTSKASKCSMLTRNRAADSLASPEVNMLSTSSLVLVEVLESQMRRKVVMVEAIGAVSRIVLSKEVMLKKEFQTPLFQISSERPLKLPQPPNQKLRLRKRSNRILLRRRLPSALVSTISLRRKHLKKRSREEMLKVSRASKLPKVTISRLKNRLLTIRRINLRSADRLATNSLVSLAERNKKKTP